MPQYEVPVIQSSPPPGSGPPPHNVLEMERQYLEGLFNSRFNFYLVFISLFFVAILQGESNLREGARPVAVLVGAIASGVMWLAILRTHLLLSAILSELRKNDESAYRWACAQKLPKRMPWEANRWLVQFPLITCLLLFSLFGWLVLPTHLLSLGWMVLPLPCA